MPRQDDFQVDRMRGVMNKERGTKAISLSLRAAGGCAAAVAGDDDDEGTGANASDEPTGAAAGRDRAQRGPSLARWLQRTGHQRRFRGDRAALGSGRHDGAAELFDGQSVCG